MAEAVQRMMPRPTGDQIRAQSVSWAVVAHFCARAFLRTLMAGAITAPRVVQLQGPMALSPQDTDRHGRGGACLNLQDWS